MIKEKDLLEMGFVLCEVSEEESGDKAFNYYTWEPKPMSGFCLISCDSDDDYVLDTGCWTVALMDDPSIVFYDRTRVESLVSIVDFAAKNYVPYAKTNQNK